PIVDVMAEDAELLRHVVVYPHQRFLPRRLAGKLRGIVEVGNLGGVRQGEEVEQRLPRTVEAGLRNHHAREGRSGQRIVDERQLLSIVVQALREVSLALQGCGDQHVLYGVGRQLALEFLAEEEEEFIL